MKRISLGAAAALAAVALSAGPAPAQFVGPGVGGFGYGGFGYGGSMAGLTYGSYLQGSASVIQAQGQYMQDYQQARIQREQSRQAKVDTRRKVFDNWMYERAMTPTPEQLRQEAMMTQLSIARNEPPPGDIISGMSLNNLLMDIRRSGRPGPTVPISPQTLSRINLAGEAANSGNFGLFKDGGKLVWPRALNSGTFREDRAQFESMVADALKQAPSGQVDGDLLDKMTTELDDLRGKLKKQVSTLSPNLYMEGTRYINDLRDGVTALGTPNVAQLADQKWRSSSTVGELVSAMIDGGMTFAPAVRGDEAAYRTLHQALVQYDLAVTTTAPQTQLFTSSRLPAGPPPGSGGFAFPETNR